MEHLISFPHMANYYVPAKYLFSHILKSKVLVAPPITNKTIELGSKYSPDFVCTPFKYTLGSFIESLELGADILVQFGGGCRYGYYSELQDKILKDLGYRFEMINLVTAGKTDIKKIYKKIKKVEPKFSIIKGLYYLLITKKMVKYMDTIDDYIRKNIGFEENKGSFKKLLKQMLNDFGNTKGFFHLKKLHKKYMKEFKNIKINKPENCLKVGVIGELYTVMEPFANYYIEYELAKKKVEITRYTNATYLLFEKRKKTKHYLKKLKNIKYKMGADAMDNIYYTKEMCENKYDGILHIKSSFCTPEIASMNVINKICKEHNVPVNFFSFDANTSEVGIKTRLEAFYDMIEMRKKVNECYLGVDIGSISTKGVIIDSNYKIITSKYIWTEGNPVEAVKKLVNDLKNNIPENYCLKGIGTTGSARKLIGLMLDANVVKNEITAHAIGTLNFYPNVKTILEIGGQDSKIILLNNGIITDYAMNTLCAAGTGSFLSSQSKRLGIDMEEFGDIALKSNNPVKIAARCTVFAESDLIHKAQSGYKKQDIVAGLCRSIVLNYLNNVGKGKKIESPIVFQGGVSKNKGVLKFFKDVLNQEVIVDENSHLMGAIGIAILSSKQKSDKIYNLEINDIKFVTKGSECNGCSNNCEILRIFKNDKLIDAWGNRCNKTVKL